MADTPGSAPRRSPAARRRRQRPRRHAARGAGRVVRRRRAAGAVACLTHHPPAADRHTADPGRVAGFGGSVWDRAVAAKADILRRVTEPERCPAEPGRHPDQRGQHAGRSGGSIESRHGPPSRRRTPRPARSQRRTVRRQPGGGPDRRRGCGTDPQARDPLLPGDGLDHRRRAWPGCASTPCWRPQSAVGQPPWLVDPQAAAEQVVALPDGVPPLLLGVVGAVLVMAGVVLPERGAADAVPATSCWTVAPPSSWTTR